MDRDEWFDFGIEKGWISFAYCATHDGFAFVSDEEMEAWDRGEDPCHVVVSVYE